MWTSRMTCTLLLLATESTSFLMWRRPPRQRLTHRGVSRSGANRLGSCWPTRRPRSSDGRRQTSSPRIFRTPCGCPARRWRYGAARRLCVTGTAGICGSSCWHNRHRLTMERLPGSLVRCWRGGRSGRCGKITSSRIRRTATGRCWTGRSTSPRCISRSTTWTCGSAG